DYPEATHIFIHAKEEDRLHRITKYYGEKEEGARELMHKIDKKRASFHEYYTGEKWGLAGSYHLSIDSGCLEIEETAKLLADFAKGRSSRSL
ncbi:MAG: cytidylate kinase-like family protein, partial [Clostridiales bacterium]|nr:cytidylate kinase-like family protein [Clostridiales bacterium]